MRIAFSTLATIGLTGLILVTPSRTPAEESQTFLLDRARGAYTAYREAARDLHWRREQSSLGRAEREDYQDYVTMLRDRVSDACIELAHSGASPPIDVPCSDIPQRADTAARAAVAVPLAKTRTETIGDLDAELRASLGEFDELLLQEEQQIKTDAPVHNGGAGSSTGSDREVGDGTGADEQRDGEAGNAGAPGGAETGDGRESGTGTASGSGGGGGGGNHRGQTGGVDGGAPGVEESPSASNDDAVARQLREAAEQETDPELKKKLWEEYKRYKKGTG